MLLYELIRRFQERLEERLLRFQLWNRWKSGPQASFVVLFGRDSLELSSLMVLQEHLSVLHQEGTDYDKEAEKLHIIRINIFFAALLPPDVHVELHELCVAFCKRVLGEERNMNVFVMLNTYNYLHPRLISNHELLDPEFLEQAKPSKGVYDMMRRFEKFYLKKQPEKVLFNQID